LKDVQLKCITNRALSPVYQEKMKEYRKVLFR